MSDHIYEGIQTPNTIQFLTFYHAFFSPLAMVYQASSSRATNGALGKIVVQEPFSSRAYGRALSVKCGVDVNQVGYLRILIYTENILRNNAILTRLKICTYESTYSQHAFLSILYAPHLLLMQILKRNIFVVNVTALLVAQTVQQRMMESLMCRNW